MASELHGGLVQKAVPFGGVAPGAARHHVLPFVLTTAAAWHDMIEIFCPPIAVLAAVVVTYEHRLAAQRCAPLMGHTDVVPQTNHAGDLDRGPFGVPVAIAGVDHLSLVTQNQHQRTTHRDHCEWLVGGVEHQRPGHVGKR